MQPVPLSSNLEYQEYPFLEEYLTEQALERIAELPYMWDEQRPIKLWYSLSNCQWDGVCFMEWKYTIKKDSELYKKIIETMETDHKNKVKEVYDMDISFYHRGNENSFSTAINVYLLTVDEQFDWTDIYPDPDQSRFYYNPFQRICQALEKLGYEYIESEDKDTVLNNGFKAFLRANRIETDDDNLYDYEYTQIEEEAKEKWYTLVCTKWDTNLWPLWVWLPDIVPHIRETEYFTFK